MTDLVDRWMPDAEGKGIVRWSLWSTALFTVVATLGVVLFDTFRILALVVALVLFGIGTVTFLWAYLISLGRSREELVHVPGVFFLSGTAPKAVRRALLGCLAVQVVVSVATASVRPFTSAAFGILVPMLGMGLAGLWGARHGTFDPRPPKPVRGRRRIDPPAPAPPAPDASAITDAPTDADERGPGRDEGAPGSR